MERAIRTPLSWLWLTTTAVGEVWLILAKTLADVVMPCRLVYQLIDWIDYSALFILFILQYRFRRVSSIRNYLLFLRWKI